MSQQAPQRQLDANLVVKHLRNSLSEKEFQVALLQAQSEQDQQELFLLRQEVQRLTPQPAPEAEEGAAGGE